MFICTEELLIDMTPSEKKCHSLLGSDHLTFLGAICKGSVVILIKADQSCRPDDANANKLMEPFNEVTVYGDILLTRSGEVKNK